MVKDLSCQSQRELLVWEGIQTLGSSMKVEKKRCVGWAGGLALSTISTHTPLVFTLKDTLLSALGLHVGAGRTLRASELTDVNVVPQNRLACSVIDNTSCIVTMCCWIWQCKQCKFYLHTWAAQLLVFAPAQTSLASQQIWPLRWQRPAEVKLKCQFAKKNWDWESQVYIIISLFPSHTIYRHFCAWLVQLFNKNTVVCVCLYVCVSETNRRKDKDIRWGTELLSSKNLVYLTD